MKKYKKPTVTAHVLVKNEENYIWYAINSVLPYVDKMIIFDTGSTDKTLEIIKGIVAKDKNKKIIFEERGEVDKQGHTDLRNEMIKRTKTDWILLLDGDEIWDSSQIKNVVDNELPFLPIFKMLGLVSFHLSSMDLSHFTELGQYFFKWGMHNQLNMRFIRNTGITFFKGPYASENLYHGKKLLGHQANYFVSTSFYYHLSKLPRSSKDNLVFARNKKSLGKYLGPFRKIFIKKTNLLPEIFKNEIK